MITRTDRNPLSTPDDGRSASSDPAYSSPDDIREFQALVRSETGVDISAEEAWSRAIELITLIRMLMGPIPEDREGEPHSGGSNVAHLPEGANPRRIHP